jgi:hypothetical protein
MAIYYSDAYIQLKIYCTCSVKPVESATGSLTICYTSFRAIHFPYFLPYSFPVLHVIESYVEADI